MILQYKGFNNNQCYIEAETITWANVWVGKETQQYRNGGDRFSIREKLREQGEKEQDDLLYIEEMHDAVDRLIQSETGTITDEIVYCVGDTRFDQLENVFVVMLSGQNLSKTYLFNRGVYLLNNYGKTVQKIAQEKNSKKIQ